MNSEEYLERVRELLPGLRERARECEELRRVPDTTVKEFDEAGLLRAVQPDYHHAAVASPPGQELACWPWR